MLNDLLAPFIRFNPSPTARRVLNGIILLLGISLTGLAQENPPQNAGVIAKLLTSPILETIATHYQPGDTLSIQSDAAPMSRWLARLLTDSCVAENYFVYSFPEAGDYRGLSLHLSEAASRIQYRVTGRKWLFFSRRLQRTVDASVHFRLSRRGQVVESHVVEDSYQDVLVKSRMAGLENPELSFTKGTKKQNAVIKRWVEPVILTAATATVIYLFYTLRSSN